MEITVRELQDYLFHNYGQRAQEQGLFMKLVEEIGEVAEVLNRRSGRKDAGEGDLQGQLANELADVIHYAAAIAAINGIDLSDTILEKDRQASIKYHHDINLETFVAARRAALKDGADA